ncbi:MAG: hypothetical protein ACK53L_34125, partial [Pirellulaceae bacterium]
FPVSSPIPLSHRTEVDEGVSNIEGSAAHTLAYRKAVAMDAEGGGSRDFPRSWPAGKAARVGATSHRRIDGAG